MKIFLDDVRTTPAEWHRCYKIEEVQRLLCEALLGGEEITNMSLDHDLGGSYLCTDCYSQTFFELECPRDCEHSCHDNDPISNPLVTPTGYDLLKWMAEHNMWSTYKPTVHSANPVGRANMQAVIDRHWHSPYGK